GGTTAAGNPAGESLPEKIIMSVDRHTKDVLNSLDLTLRSARPDWVDDLPTRSDLDEGFRDSFKKASARIDELGNDLNDSILMLASVGGAASPPAGDAASPPDVPNGDGKSVPTPSPGPLPDPEAISRGVLMTRSLIAASDGRTAALIDGLAARIDGLEARLASSSDAAAIGTEAVGKAVADLAARPWLDPDEFREAIDGAVNASAAAADRAEASAAASDEKTAALADDLSKRLDAQSAMLSAAAAGSADRDGTAAAGSEGLKRAVDALLTRHPYDPEDVSRAASRAEAAAAAAFDRTSDLVAGLSSRIDSLEDKLSAFRAATEQALVKASESAASRAEAAVSASEARTARLIGVLTDKINGLGAQLSETEAALAEANGLTLAQATRAALPWYKRIIR
ncbi:MAG: hypothetical protein LBQ79_14710, partial [Deltaproteobacteria bacterium]|nr:hypothetical protein [Deltaproteobacteria bacterium]